jgi:hypothetical protein
MDLINKLQNLKETTQSREVKDLCDTYITELKKGNTSITESQISEVIEFKEVNTVSPIEALRNEELERSRSRAKMIAESWGGLNAFNPSKNSGSYVDGAKEEEKPSSEIQNKLNEALEGMAKFDKSTTSFVDSNKVENLGILESILELSKKGIYEHASFKILCENYVNVLKNKNVPEYWVAENFISEFSNFSWDNSVKAVVNKVSESCNNLRPEIEVSKALYQIENTGSSDFYSPVKESISKWLVSESKSIPALSRDLRVWSFNPVVKNLINTLTFLETNSSKMNIPAINGNSEIRRIYSPVLVEGNKTIFAIGKTLFEGSSEGIRKLSNRDISNMDKEFLGLLETFCTEGVKVDDKGILIYVGDTRISIVEENEETKIYLNENLAKFSDYNQLAKLISLGVSRGLATNENKVIADIIRLYENFDRIVELDFAKSVVSKVYEGASVSLIKWNGKIFLQRVNESMRENSLFAVNGSQAANIVKDFLKYDVSEGLTEFLDGERKIKSIMINDRKKVIENIAIVEGEMKKIETLVASNPLFKGSNQLSQAYSILEKELQTLKSKWSTINAELDSIENSPIEIDELMEDSKFAVGDYVKVKENGNTGKIISVDTTSGSYTVLLDSGKTGDFGVEDIVDLEDAFQKSSDENAEEGEGVKESSTPLAKAPSAGKAIYGKTPAQVLKASTSAAPSAKTQDQDGKKDVENLKDANLEEAPDSKNKPTDYEVNDEVGYNLEESTHPSLATAPEGKPKGTNMATEWEKSGLKAMNLASTPGKEEGDAGYKVEYPDPKASKKPEIAGDSEMAVAPGMANLEMSESDLSKLDTAMATAPGAQVGDSGYKTRVNIPKSSSPEIDNLLTAELVTAPEKGSKVPSKDTTDPNLATSPGKIKGDSGYEVEYLDSKTSKDADIDNLDTANLAETPSKGADGEVNYELNAEMGYNIGEGEATQPTPNLDEIRNFIMENKDSEEVQKILQDILVNEGFERPSPELKKN